jgi:tRNA threonylcarbamoyladenosine biosynthesis protein TsaB
MKPRILGIETSGTIGGFALVEGERVLAEVTSDITGRHVEKGAAMIEYVLESGQMTPDDLAGVAVSLGPGSFTGLRVGLALAKGICFGRGLPLLGVPTLDCMAEAFALSEGLVAPVKDARRGEIYFGLYRASHGQVIRLAEYRALSPDLAINEIEEKIPSGGRVLLVGDAISKYGDMFHSRLGPRALAAPELAWPVRPGLVAALGSRMLAEGKIAQLDTVEPIYVRSSEAERKATRFVASGRDRDRDKKDEGK